MPPRRIMMALMLAGTLTRATAADPPTPAAPAAPEDEAVAARCKALNAQRDAALKARASMRDQMSRARWEAILTRIDEEQRRLNCGAGST